MSFPNKWNQFVAPQKSQAASSRRNYWKYAKRHSGVNNDNLSREPPRPRAPITIGPLWNGCISVNNHHQPRDINNRSPTERRRTEPTSAINTKTGAPPSPGDVNNPHLIEAQHRPPPNKKTKYHARLNNDLRGLWQLETPLNNMYAPSTSIPTFSVQLSGSLFANQQNSPAAAAAALSNPPQTEQHQMDSRVYHQMSSASASINPSYIPSSDPPRSPTSIDYFSSFPHTSPTVVMSSLNNHTLPPQQEIDQMSIVRNEPCNILPQVTFYEHLCSIVNSACEDSINTLYDQDRTTMDTILQQCRQTEPPPTPSVRLNESDWPFSPMTVHETGPSAASPAASFGTNLGNESNAVSIIDDLEDSSFVGSALDVHISDRLF